MARAQYGPFIKEAASGDQRQLARLLTLIENDTTDFIKFLAKQKDKKQKSMRIGISGPPGAGKSTLVNLLIKEWRAQDLKVGVLAVDPSSPFSGGALLGDRIRMSEHATDKNVFIRSIGSRGGLGGLSSATGCMARALELSGFDVVIIETVGVGQTELEIMNLSDATAIVLVPESGDVVQTLKAGILEIADCFVVNKCDRPGADVLAHELRALVEQECHSKFKRAVFLTSATKPQTGGAASIKDLSKHLLELAEKFKSDKSRAQRKAWGELRGLLLQSAFTKIQKKMMGLKISDPYKAFQKIKGL